MSESILMPAAEPKPLVPGVHRRTIDGEPVIIKRVGDVWTARFDAPVGVGRTPEEALSNLQMLRGKPTEDEKALLAMGIKW